MMEQLREEVSELQFDLFARYSVLSKILLALLARGAGSKYRLLDVGAGPMQLTKLFLPPDYADVVCTDVESFGVDHVVAVAPGQPLPFPDRSFDAVIAMDVLEHMPEQQRMGFLTECARAAAQFVVIATPLASSAVSTAEDEYDQIHLAIAGKRDPFIEEHRRYGRASPNELRLAAAQLGFQLVEIDNVAVADWLAFNVADLVVSSINDGYAAKRALSQQINLGKPGSRLVCQQGEHYRRFYVLFRNPRQAGELSEYLGSAGIVNPEAPPENALLVLANQFKAYIEKWHGPTITEVSNDQHVKIADLLATLALKEQHIAKIEQAQRDHAAASKAEFDLIQQALREKDVHILKLEELYREEVRKREDADRLLNLGRHDAEELSRQLDITKQELDLFNCSPWVRLGRRLGVLKSRMQPESGSSGKSV